MPIAAFRAALDGGETLTIHESINQNPTTNRLFNGPMIISLITSLGVFILKQFFFGFGDSFYKLFVGVFILIFLCSLLPTILNFFKFIFKKKKAEELPAWLITSQVLTLLLLFAYPTPDFYKVHQKGLEKLAIFMEKQYPDRSVDQVIDLSLPKDLEKEFKMWFVQAYIRDKVLKIDVTLSGSAFGAHRFMLYRSDGKNPGKNDLYIRPTGSSLYIRKSDKWFFIDWND